MSFSISWIIFCHVALDYFFHSMSLTCFLSRAFIIISWLDTPFHFVFIHLMLWDMFMIIFLHYTPITGSVPHHLFDPWFDFRLDAHIFIIERWKAHFHIHTFFERFALITLSFFFLWSSSWRLNQGYFWSRLSIDLVIVLFFTPHSLSSHLDPSLDHR